MPSREPFPPPQDDATSINPLPARLARTHDVLDRRSLALHMLIVETIRKNPELMAKVRANLARWSLTVAPGTQPYVQAWQKLLEQGDEAILQAAIATGEQANAMRQASPFAGVLPHKIRSRFLREWVDEKI